MITKLTIEFGAGTHITPAIREATFLARKHNCEVEFNFNGDVYSGGKKIVEKRTWSLEFVDVKKEEE